MGGRGEDGTVARVDPDGPRKAKRFETGSRPAAIAVAGGKVWAAADAPQTSHRGGTLRVRLPYAPKAGIALDPLHPLAYTTIMGVELNSLLYDGLVAYRRVPGAAGAHARRCARDDRAGARRLRQDVHLHAAARAPLLRRAAG